MSDFVYLYGFAPRDTQPPANLTGIADRAVELIALNGVQAAISHVPADVYQPAQLETRLQDLSWVAQQGIGHETAVAWFVDHAQILPAPLFTMYSSEAALKSAAAPRLAEVAAELQRLQNKREWDVKVSLNERLAEEHAAELSPRIAELDAEAAQATPGKRYLLQRKRDDLVKTETRQAAAALAREVMDAAASMAIETRAMPIPRTADDLPVILFGALLVEREKEAALIKTLESEAERLRARGLDLTFSGPWAPYRFTGEHERAAAGN